MKKQKKQEVTEKLVTKVYLDTRLGLVDKRFDTVDEWFDGMKIYIDERLFDTKKGLKEEITEEIRGETAKILEAVDGVMIRFDRAEKEEAAHTILHKRITDTVHEHDQRIGRLEASIKS